MSEVINLGDDLMDIMASLKKLIDAGRGNEQVKLQARHGYEPMRRELEGLGGTILEAYNKLADIANRGASKNHIIEDGTSLPDIVTSLKALIAAGRGDETVEYRGDLKAGLQLNGTVHESYPLLLRFAREQMRESVARVAEKLEKAKWALSAENRALVADTDPITPATEAGLQAWLDNASADAVGLRRELLASGEFAAEVEMLDDQIAQIASLIREPLGQPASGAGKVRVLDEKRLARDENEVRDLPLRDKLARAVKLRDGIGADSSDDKETHKAAQDLNTEVKDLMRQVTGKPLIKAIEDIMQETWPDMVRAFYPRIYEHTGRYHSPRSMAVMIANVVAEMLRYGYHKSATAYRLMMPGLADMRKHNMPMFFLAPDLLEAVLRTDFDDDIDWTQLDLPYESGMLMLPRGALVHPVDGEVAMLMWARVAKGEHTAPWPGIPASVMPQDSFVLLGACPDSMIWYDSILTSNVRPTMRLRNLFYREPGQPVPHVQKSNFMDADLDERDSAFLEQMGVILFGTILAMNARPQLIERGALIKRVGKGTDKVREFWSPNVIGGKYKFKREKAAVVDGRFVVPQREHGTHASPRLHWRRGHYRNQPFGPGRKERRIIWLEPCLIGAE